MIWIVKIENKINQRIKVVFDPMSEQLTFTGQFKPHNEMWTDFSEETHSINIDLTTISNLLFDVQQKMEERLSTYKNVEEVFSKIKIVEINGK